MPVVAVTVPFLVGIAAGTKASFLTTTSLAVFFLALAWMVSRIQKRLASTALLLAAYLFLGAASRQLAERKIHQQPLLQIYRSIGEAGFQDPCLLTGVVREEPLWTSETVRLRVEVQTLRRAGVTRSAAGNVRVHVRGDPVGRRFLARFEPGDRIALWARLRRPRGYRNPGGFDVEAYLARRGITLSGTVKSPLLVERLSSGRWWSPTRMAAWARGLVRRRIRNAFDRRYADSLQTGEEVPGVAIALLIGDRSFLPRWAERLYQASGIFHVIVISGAHVALIAGLLYGSLRWLGVDRAPALVALLLVLPIYAMICGGRPPVVRAVTMCVCVVGSRLLSLDAPAVNGLAFSALLLLTARPLELGDAGFQLSFAATAAILLLARPLAHRLARGGRPGYLTHALSLSLVAQAAVTPLIVWHFQRLTLGAVGASLVAMPLAAFSLVASALVVAFDAVPWLGDALAWGVWQSVSGLTACSRFALAVPGASFRIPHPGWSWLVSYVALLLAACCFRGRLRWVAGMLLCVVILWLPFRPSSTEPGILRLVVFDVGHGDCLLLELPDGRRMLVDAGGSFDRSFDVGESVVVPALLHRGVRTLHAVVLTHPDFDHLGGLASVMSELDVKEVWGGRPAWTLLDYRELRRTARLHGVRVRRLGTGEAMDWGEVQVEVLAAGVADRDAQGSRNNDSLVLRVCYGGTCLLLTGDAEEALERELVRSGKSLRADVLKVAHHGSRSSTSARFLDSVRPRVAVVSTGRGNPYLPAAEVMDRLRERGVTILRTDLDGAVTVAVDRRGRIQLDTFTSSR